MRSTPPVNPNSSSRLPGVMETIVEISPVPIVVLDPDGNRGAERTTRLVETARSVVTSLEPVARVCGAVPGSQLQAALKPMAQGHTQLKDFVEDAEADIQRATTRKPAGFAP